MEDLRTAADKSEGALEQLKKQLSKEHGCSTPKQGNRLLAKLKEELETLESDYNSSLEQFEKDLDNALR